MSVERRPGSSERTAFRSRRAEGCYRRDRLAKKILARSSLRGSSEHPIRDSYESWGPLELATHYADRDHHVCAQPSGRPAGRVNETQIERRLLKIERHQRI
jgi:hypothetical protein